MLAGIAAEIDQRRAVGARVIVEPPFYRGITIVARLVARPGNVLEVLEKHALAALYRHFDPVVGGMDGTGWAFGRPVLAGEVYAVLQAVPGVELVDELKLWEADPVTGKRAGEPTTRIDLDANALVYSYSAQRACRGGRHEMRGLVPGLASPAQLLQRLPGVYQDASDVDFFPRFLRAFDDSIAPTISTLDNLAAYMDPRLAPEDFVDWLAGWVDVAPDGAWTLEQRRAIVSQAVAIHRRAGTLDGIRDAVQLSAGPDATVTVEDNGAVAWSSTPGGRSPGLRRRT